MPECQGGEGCNGPSPSFSPKGLGCMPTGSCLPVRLGLRRCALPPYTWGLRFFLQDREEERLSGLRMFLVGRSELGRHCLPCWGEVAGMWAWNPQG